MSQNMELDAGRRAELAAEFSTLLKDVGPENDGRGAVSAHYTSLSISEVVALLTPSPQTSPATEGEVVGGLTLNAEAFQRGLVDGIVSRLAKLTVGTCSCGTMTPELKHHAESCRYRIAAEALELVRPALAAPPPSKAGEGETGPANEADFWAMMREHFAHDLSPEAMADDLGYSRSTVSRWINGRTAPHSAVWPTITAWIKAKRLFPPRTP